MLRVVVLFVAFTLVACADTSWPTWVTGEPEAGTLRLPAALGSPRSRHDTAYPNLSSVPKKPDDFSTPDFRKEAIRRLTEDRTEAHAIKQRVDLEFAPEPVLPSYMPMPPQFPKEQP